MEKKSDAQVLQEGVDYHAEALASLKVLVEKGLKVSQEAYAEIVDALMKTEAAMSRVPAREKRKHAEQFARLDGIVEEIKKCVTALRPNAPN